VDTILRILLGESYNGIRALADLSVSVNKYQQAFWCHCREIVAVLESNQDVYVSLFFSTTTIITHHMDSTPIHKFLAPKGEFLEPPQSSKPIIASGFKLRPGIIAMVWEQSFSRKEDKNPYTHL